MKVTLPDQRQLTVNFKNVSERITHSFLQPRRATKTHIRQALKPRISTITTNCVIAIVEADGSQHELSRGRAFFSASEVIPFDRRKAQRDSLRAALGPGRGWANHEDAALAWNNPLRRTGQVWTVRAERTVIWNAYEDLVKRQKALATGRATPVVLNITDGQPNA